MIHWLEEVNRTDRQTVGKNAATLGTLMDDSFNVPRGFIIEPETFTSLLSDNNYRQRIDSALDQVTIEDHTDLYRTSDQIQGWIDSISLPDETVQNIQEAYEQINLDHKVRNAGEKAVELVGGQRETPFVAVRGHDTGGTSTVYDTFLGINGKDAVVHHIKEAWKSYYSPLALKQRVKNSSSHQFTVLIQSMVEPEVSGSVFTRDPFNGRDTVLVESVYGIGSSLADGITVPDRFYVDRNTGRLSHQTIATKEWKIERDPSTGSTIKHRVPDNQQDEQTLSDNQLSTIVNTAIDIDNKYDRPVKVDLSIGRNKTYILGVSGINQAEYKEQETEEAGLINGVRAAPGTGSGTTYIAYEENDIEHIEDESVVVSINASPLLSLPSESVEAIVTEKGGISSTLATLAREEGIPVLVDCTDATNTLTSGDTITVNCSTETVTEGTAHSSKSTETEKQQSSSSQQEENVSTIATATGILTVNETVEKADGTVAMRYSDVKEPDWVLEAGSPEKRIHQEMKESFQGGGFLVDTYANVLQLSEAQSRDATHIFLDISSLQREGAQSAVHRAIEEASSAANSSACSLILEYPDDELIKTAVEAGIDNIVVPPDQFNAFQQQIERAERGFILERLREQ